LDILAELRAQQQDALVAFATQQDKQLNETASALRAKCEQEVRSCHFRTQD
jgi:hypothetical protein